MSSSKGFGETIKKILPAPFTIAVILTFVTFILGLTYSDSDQTNYFFQIITYWEKGLWDNQLLVFAMQMMLMLVLGHSLALSETLENLIEKATSLCNSTSIAAAIITFSTLLVSLFNWGLGLIFGAIFARKVGEYATKNNIKLNYPLIGAAGYSGLMVWHGGISGSAPIKIAEKGHFLEEKIGVITQSQTVFSSMNISISILLLIILPLLMYYIGKKTESKKVDIICEKKTLSPKIIGAEKLDHSNFLALLFGSVILLYCIHKAFILPTNFNLSFITPNFINLTLLGLCIILHKNFYRFINSVNSAIVGAAGILIQFPLYFGIMGIMKYSGLIDIMSDMFILISNENTFPIFTFLSAGIVNVFVPSGGGQWAVQGPIIIEAHTQGVVLL